MLLQLMLNFPTFSLQVINSSSAINKFKTANQDVARRFQNLKEETFTSLSIQDELDTLYGIDEYHFRSIFKHSG